MDLILKSTERCNFKCTFCSSTDIVDGDDRAITLDLNRVYRFLDRYPNTQTIILNGGDPLMLKPDYYWKLIEELDRRNSHATLSFTTNLWPFYKNPETWQDLFRHPRVGVTTSFNYGGTRLITSTREFTEQDFRRVSELFLERIGYRPDFIAVITDENYDSCIQTVELAKEMDVECKLNYAMASGVQSRPLQLSKIYAMYVKVYEAGLWQWEFNTKQLMKRLWSGNTVCPQNRECHLGIRAFNPDGSYYSCGSFGDDKDYPLDFEMEMAGGTDLPFEEDPQLISMHDGCFGCPMFEICNGCRKTIKDHKQHSMVADHCTLMKTLIPSIIGITNDVTGDDSLRSLLNQRRKPIET